MQFAGRFFDGLTAAQHIVQLELSQDRLALVIEGDTLEAPLRWPLADLRATGDHAEEHQIVLMLFAETDDERPRDPARLILDDTHAVAWIKKTRPNLYRADMRSGSGRKILRRSVMAVGAIALMLFVILPALANSLANFIPREREIAFGKSVVGQIERFLGGREIGELVCSNPEGDAALEAMVARLSEGQDLGYDLDVHVMDAEMVNAFAAPGGQIVLLKGLLDEASGPDAVAAVLAHEIAHVENRDSTRAALRTAGSAGIVSLVLGDVTGGVIFVALAEQVINSSYSREAETIADEFALAMLDSSGVSAVGMGEFFEQLGEIEGGFSLPAYLATHPATEGRAERAHGHAAGQGATRPALTDAQWVDLQSICDE